MDIIEIHRRGKEHNEKLKELLDRLQNKGQMLRVERCQFGAAETTWFGYIYDKDRMRIDPRKMRITGDRIRTKNKAVQTQEVCRKLERTEEW